MTEFHVSEDDVRIVAGVVALLLVGFVISAYGLSAVLAAYDYFAGKPSSPSPYPGAPPVNTSFNPRPTPSDASKLVTADYLVNVLKWRAISGGASVSPGASFLGIHRADTTYPTAWINGVQVAAQITRGQLYYLLAGFDADGDRSLFAATPSAGLSVSDAAPTTLEWLLTLSGATFDKGDHSQHFHDAVVFPLGWFETSDEDGLNVNEDYYLRLVPKEGTVWIQIGGVTWEAAEHVQLLPNLDIATRGAVLQLMAAFHTLPAMPPKPPGTPEGLIPLAESWAWLRGIDGDPDAPTVNSAGRVFLNLGGSTSLAVESDLSVGICSSFRRDNYQSLPGVNLTTRNDLRRLLIALGRSGVELGPETA